MSLSKGEVYMKDMAKTWKDISRTLSHIEGYLKVIAKNSEGVSTVAPDWRDSEPDNPEGVCDPQNVEADLT